MFHTQSSWPMNAVGYKHAFKITILRSIVELTDLASYESRWNVDYICKINCKWNWLKCLEWIYLQWFNKWPSHQSHPISYNINGIQQVFGERGVFRGQYRHTLNTHPQPSSDWLLWPVINHFHFVLCHFLFGYVLRAGSLTIRAAAYFGLQLELIWRRQQQHTTEKKTLRIFILQIYKMKRIWQHCANDNGRKIVLYVFCVNRNTVHIDSYRWFGSRFCYSCVGRRETFAIVDQ